MRFIHATEGVDIPSSFMCLQKRWFQHPNLTNLTFEFTSHGLIKRAWTNSDIRSHLNKNEGGNTLVVWSAKRSNCTLYGVSLERMQCKLLKSKRAVVFQSNPSQTAKQRERQVM